ncbi:MAG TPA: ABC transporter ATP-binding protein [Clostridia bacterium]|nr:ABC transporter ATP-binding protein [Clostridia bacterium]
MTVIDVKSLTLTYPSKKGIFDLNFTVNTGEVMGYLGPNGSGKTTTIRALLGFMKPDSGTCSINGLDCWKQAPKIQKILGYIPGEIAFPDNMTGDEFLRFMHAMRGTKDTALQKQLLDTFELNPKGKIKKFSKGMKQKLGIVTAFMHNPEILVLDEPTSGLDPLMQNRFVDLILAEKKKGKTILMSSHIFEEVERTCDNVLIIKEGRIVKQSDIQSLQKSQRKGFVIKSDDAAALGQRLILSGYEVKTIAGDAFEVYIPAGDIDRFIKSVSEFTVTDFDIKLQTLESIFMQYYSKEGKS